MPKKQGKRRARPQARKRKSRRAQANMPVSMSRPSRRTAANITSGVGELRVRHREMFYDMSTTTSNIQILTLGVSPSSPGLFPWLSRMAVLYQSYRINSLRIEWHPACPTLTPGTVYALFDYNWHDANVKPYSELSQSMGFRDSPAYREMVVPLDRKQQLFRDKLYTGTPPANADASLYRTASLVFGNTSTNSTPTKLGRWFVSYDITLITPQPAADAPLADFGATVFEFESNGDANNLFGTVTQPPDTGNDASISNGILNFARDGDYLATLQCEGTGGMDASPPELVSSSGVVGSLTDIILSSGTKTIFQYALQSVIAGATAYWKKVGVVGLGHTDVQLSPYDLATYTASKNARAAAAAERQRLIADVAAYVHEHKGH